MKHTTLQGLAMTALAIGWTLLTALAFILAFILAVAGVEPAGSADLPLRVGDGQSQFQHLQAISPARARRMARNRLPVEIIDSGDAVEIRSVLSASTVPFSAEPLLSDAVRPAAPSQPRSRSRARTPRQHA